MNKIVKKALEIMKKADACWQQELPDVEIKKNYKISDIWDGNGEKPEESCSYQITDAGEDGESNYPIYINYIFEIIEKKEDFLETIIQIKGIELI